MSIDVEDVALDALTQAKVIPLMPPGVPVVFSYNPEKITITRTARNRQTGTGDGAQKQRAATPGRVLKCDAWLEGPQTHMMAQQLIETMSPTGGLIGAIMALAGVNLMRRPPILLFEWGPLTMLCTMKSCNVSYERFHASGIPLRAKCQIQLEEAPTFFSMLLTNPTSGGLPGREQHTIVAGENLQQIAMRSYGNPGRWREVAEVNGIDDPFSVKAGDVLFVPSPNELNTINKS